MLDAFERGFLAEMRKTAFESGFLVEMEKQAILPILIGLGAGALMGGATLGIAAGTKPPDLTWRGAGFTPGKIMGHLGEWASVGMGAGAIGKSGLMAKLDRLQGYASGVNLLRSDAPNPMSFRPASIAATPLSQLTKKVPGAF